MSKPSFTTIDEYLKGLPALQRAALERLRRDIRAAVPGAEECISYQLPAFRLNGMLVGFGASARHCAFYLMSGTIVSAFKVELAPYDTSKGTIRFSAESPLPSALVKKLVKARIQENAALRGSATKKVAPARASARGARPNDTDSLIAELKSLGTKETRAMMEGFGIPTEKAFGVTVARLRAIAKRVGKDHELALALWKTGWYEARMLAAFVDQPDQVTSRQMDAWCRDFDNWAICDTVCFHLFDKTEFAFERLHAWASREPEFQRRGAFALLWGLSLHAKSRPDHEFEQALDLIRRYANDPRHYVTKAISMALRAIGKRNSRLHALALELADELEDSANAVERALGKEVRRELIARSSKPKAVKGPAKASVAKRKPPKADE